MANFTLPVPLYFIKNVFGRRSPRVENIQPGTIKNRGYAT